MRRDTDIDGYTPLLFPTCNRSAGSQPLILPRALAFPCPHRRTILATTRHPALQFVMQHLLSNWRRKKDGNVLDGEHFVHELTGPGIWTEAIAHYLGREGKSAGELFAAVSEAEAPQCPPPPPLTRGTAADTRVIHRSARLVVNSFLCRIPASLHVQYSNDPVVRAEMQWKGVYLLPRESFNRRAKETRNARACRSLGLRQIRIGRAPC